MRIGAGLADTGRATVSSANLRGRRFSQMESKTVREGNDGWQATGSNLLQAMMGDNDEKTAQAENDTDEKAADDRSEATKIYEAAFQGGDNPIENLRTVPKVPYGYLARDGVINYNGVTFICDERSNSICLGDMSDRSQVLCITLSGGGHLNVNRANIGQLSKAIGMFSPEDVNLILRAIHQDTKLQSMQKEIEDLEYSVGEELASGEDAAGETKEEKEAEEEF